MAENELKEGENKKSSKKMIIIAGLVLSIAGGGAGYYFMQEDPVAEGSEEAASEPVEEEAEEGEGDDEVLDNEDFYYDLESPLIVNFPKGSGASLIQVSLSFLVKGEDGLTAIKKHEPMVRNYLLMAISAKSSQDLKTSEGKIALRTDMLDKTKETMKKVTGKHVVENIFFTAFVMQ